MVVGPRFIEGSALAAAMRANIKIWAPPLADYRHLLRRHQHHLHAEFCMQCHHRSWLDAMPRDQRRTIALHDRRQQQPRLHHGKCRPDAHTRPRAKWEVGERWMLSARHRVKPLRPETLWLDKVLGHVVYYPGTHHGNTAPGQVIAFQLVVFQRAPPHHPGRWEQA